MTVIEPQARPGAAEKLIAAACNLLAEVGPRAASVRAIAELAGVNHGLVHHYFGSKDALLRSAMSRLVHEHAESARERAGSGPVPAALGLLEDPRYLHAVVRCVLDGEMDLARTELEEGDSIPLRAYMDMVARKGETVDPHRLKALVGLGMAIEMGWAALEPFIAAVTGVQGPDELASVRHEAVILRNQIAREWF